jgi:hypothetical protein
MFRRETKIEKKAKLKCSKPSQQTKSMDTIASTDLLAISAVALPYLM